MFQATDQIVHEQSDSMQYHLLYYQFIKHAFGLPYRDEYNNEIVHLKLFFDEIPDTKEQMMPSRHTYAICKNYNSLRRQRSEFNMMIFPRLTPINIQYSSVWI